MQESPSSQLPQSVQIAAPAVLYVFAAQLLQLDEPAAAEVPAKHEVHWLAAVPEKLPAGQERHTADRVVAA